jgi:hypothetical protein
MAYTFWPYAAHAVKRLGRDIDSRQPGPLHFSRLQQELDSGRIALAADSPIDPEIRTITGDRPLAPLSARYAQTFTAGLQIEICPVLQRYSARIRRISIASMPRGFAFAPLRIHSIDYQLRG